MTRTLAADASHAPSFTTWLRCTPRSIEPSALAMRVAAVLDDTLGFGNVIAAEQTWDYTTGKLVSDKDGQSRVLPENRSIRTDALIVEQIKRLGLDDAFLSKHSNDWPAAKPGTVLRLRSGPIASGGSVVEQDAMRKSIKERDGKTIGLDMETHAVATACWYSMKADAQLYRGQGSC